MADIQAQLFQEDTKRWVEQDPGCEGTNDFLLEVCLLYIQSFFQPFSGLELTRIFETSCDGVLVYPFSARKTVPISSALGQES